MSEKFFKRKEDGTGNNFRRWYADTNTIKTEKTENFCQKEKCHL